MGNRERLAQIWGSLVGRITEANTRDHIDATIALWKDRCLLGAGSLTQPEVSDVWTLDNIKDLSRRFTDNPILGTDGGGRFATKFATQLADATASVRLLAAELLLVHLLFPSSVSQRGKLSVVNNALDGTSWTVPPDSVPYKALSQSIGNPGIGFNTRRDLQVAFLIDFMLRVKKLDTDEMRKTLDMPWTLWAFTRMAPQPQQREMMHVLLHLLHPDTFERIASASHKREIVSAFKEILHEGDNDDAAESDHPGRGSVDWKLLEIRTQLKNGLLPNGANVGNDIDFYYPPLLGVWQPHANADGATDIESLEWKKQLILYGPPGTSKTHSVTELAKTLITREAIRKWGPKKFFNADNQAVLKERLTQNIEWVQLHPGYGYAEFIRGLRLDGNETRYEPGLLPNLIDRANHQNMPEGLEDLPFVLVLDEINRTDLSAMLGEAFSLLERDKRGRPVSLPGINKDEPPTTLTMPDKLFVIGTMNEIDQSVETLDYALRRRFLWRECPFDRSLLLDIIRYRWDEIAPKFTYQDAEEQLEDFADRATALNTQIAGMAELGRAYQVGHTYFADITFFLSRWLTTDRRKPKNGTYLWAGPGKPQPPLNDLWDRSLKPLLEQYLSGTDDRDQSLKALQATFLGS